MRRLGALVVVIVGATFFLPWWSVAVVGLLYGLVVPSAKAWEAGVGAMLGWGVLLLVAAAQGPVGVLVARLGALFHVPGAALLVVTVLFAGVLGWGGAAVSRSGSSAS
jgi:hypothetical protein